MGAFLEVLLDLRTSYGKHEPFLSLVYITLNHRQVLSSSRR